VLVVAVPEVCGLAVDPSEFSL